MKRALRIGFWGILGIAAVIGLAAWAVRDVPRRTAERTLAKALDGRVRIGRLEVETTSSFRLLDVSIGESTRLPWLREASFDEVGVQGRLEELRRGRVEAVRVDGGEIHLQPAFAAPSPSSSNRPAAEVEDLQIEGATVVFHSTDGESRLNLSGTAGGPVRALEGTFRFHAPTFDARGLLGFLLRPDLRARLLGRSKLRFERPYEDVHGNVDLHEGGTKVRIVGAGTGELELHADGVRFPLPDFEVEVTREEGGRLIGPQIWGTLQTEGLYQLDFAAARPERDAPLVPTRVRLETTRADAFLLAAGWTPPRGVESGTSTVDLRRTEGVWTIDGEASFPRLEVPLDHRRLEAREATVSVAAQTIGPELGGPYQTRLDLSLAGAMIPGSGLTPSMEPRSLHFEGVTTLDDGTVLDGKVQVETAAAGRLTTEGPVHLDGPARADLAIRWNDLPDGGLARLIEETVGGRGYFSRLSGRPYFSGRLKGPLAAPRIDGRFAIDRLDLERDGVRLADASFRAGLAFAGSELRLRSAELDGTLAAPILGTRHARLEGDAVASLPPGAVHLHSGSLSLEDLGEFEVSGRWQPRREDPGRLELSTPGLDANTALAVLGPKAEALVPRGGGTSTSSHALI